MPDRRSHPHLNPKSTAGPRAPPTPTRTGPTWRSFPTMSSAECRRKMVGRSLGQRLREMGQNTNHVLSAPGSRRWVPVTAVTWAHLKFGSDCDPSPHSSEATTLSFGASSWNL